MADFEKISNFDDYVAYLRMNGAEVVQGYKDAKDGCVRFDRIVEPGERVQTDAGNVKETDFVSQERRVLVTAVDREGNPVLKDGKENSWAIEESKFRKLFDQRPDPETGVFKPIGEKRTLVQVDRDVSIFASWNDWQNLVKGSYIRIDDPTDRYGVDKDLFAKTYTVTDRTQEPVRLPIKQEVDLVQEFGSDKELEEYFRKAEEQLRSGPETNVFGFVINEAQQREAEQSFMRSAVNEPVMEHDYQRD